MAGISLDKGDLSDPLISFADRISVDDDGPSTNMGVAGVESPDNPGEIRQLSEMAWKQLNPEQAETEEDGTTSSTTSSGDGGGRGSMQSSAGVSDLGAVPDFGPTTYGNPNGGNFVTDDATTAETIVKVAKAMLGKPYIWGGEGWNGADCSGLVQLAYKQAGIDMPRLSNYQMNKGKRIDYKDLKPGDLIGWNNSNHVVGADHIAIYIGNNQYIEAPRPGASIRVSDLMSYGTDMMWAVRIPSNKPVLAQRPKPKPKPVSNGGTTSARALENQSKPKPKPKPQPKTQAEMHSTGKLAVRN